LLQTADPSSLTRAMDDRLMRCGIISSCQSAVIFETVKELLTTSPSRVRSAIANTGLYQYRSSKLLAKNVMKERVKTLFSTSFVCLSCPVFCLFMFLCLLRKYFGIRLKVDVRILTGVDVM